MNLDEELTIRESPWRGRLITMGVLAVMVRLAVAAATGLVAGVYPAWRTKRFDPIEALRHE